MLFGGCLFFKMLFLFLSPFYSQDTIIDNPAISRRCEQLLNQYHYKKKYFLRLNELIARNDRLQKRTPVNKLSIKTALKQNMLFLKRKSRLGKVGMEQFEESIVKMGCPGISHAAL